jgi:hypothetical protein
MNNRPLFSFCFCAGTVVLASFSIASSLNGAPLVYHYEGEIAETWNLGGPPPSQFTQVFQPGRTWTLDFVIDPDARNQSAFSTIGWYPQAGTSLSFNLANGLYVGSIAQGVVTVQVNDNDVNGTPLDDLYVNASVSDAQQMQLPSVAGLRVLCFDTWLDDPSATAFNSTRIPTLMSPSSFDFGSYQYCSFFMDWSATGDYSGAWYRVMSKIDSLTIIPEPGIENLLLFTAALLWLARRKLT